MSGGASFLLRMRLPDQPGVLGRVATALGNVGADIESIVVVDRDRGHAVDDLIVGLPAGALADRLVSAVTSVSGVVVESFQRHHGRRRLYDDLTLLDDALSSSAPLQALVDGLPELLQVSYAIVAAAAPDGATVTATSAGAPDAVMRDWLPIAAAEPLAATVVWDDPGAAGPDCELLAAPFRDRCALLLGRIGGPPFLPAEQTRVSHLTRLAQALLAEEVQS
ncbi:MAG TPA: ACT domain-containing protein [Mycobacteriales bacterium]|nr:ACT domain-containing protein [Mycobacteriales bacterium]